ncbi:hypothetical protein PYCCODRAFT_54318 [Trametes coccinea BRFM310]|uniref:Uncharacterized protein n=1 Tax=Trametes coccinea (strain BRFM310) TaxID=1353009 RepID=A0A1Y2J5Y4_TRAC3|nr:hypothetical protein PYCCODRAFT_54318 [Trametes coccinea BRFM310]
MCLCALTVACSEISVRGFCVWFLTFKIQHHDTNSTRVQISMHAKEIRPLFLNALVSHYPRLSSTLAWSIACQCLTIEDRLDLSICVGSVYPSYDNGSSGRLSLSLLVGTSMAPLPTFAMLYVTYIRFATRRHLCEA